MISPITLNTIGSIISSELIIVNIVESAFVSRIEEYPKRSSTSFIIYSGESLAKAYGLPNGASLDGWTCRIQVRDIARSVKVFDKVVTTKNTAGTLFLENITPATTELWEEGIYVIAAQLDNSSTAESGEVVEQFEVRKDWVY